MNNLIFFLLASFFFCACGENLLDKKSDTILVTDTPKSLGSDLQFTSKDSAKNRYAPIEIQLRELGLVNVKELDSNIVVDLRYSSSNNFIGIDVYGDFAQCYLQAEVAEKLLNAQKFLKLKFPYYTLIVFDAVRPLSIQQKMWDTLVLPPGEKTKYLSNPNNGSLHNYGAAVDLSIIDDKGILLDMGTDFDFFGEKAHPNKEDQLIASGELSHRQVLNREILRGVMYRAGFFGIQTEWWHFNSCTREVASLKYELVK